MLLHGVFGDASFLEIQQRPNLGSGTPIAVIRQDGRYFLIRLSFAPPHDDAPAKAVLFKIGWLLAMPDLLQLSLQGGLLLPGLLKFRFHGGKLTGKGGVRIDDVECTAVVHGMRNIITRRIILAACRRTCGIPSPGIAPHSPWGMSELRWRDIGPLELWRSLAAPKKIENF